MNKPIYSDFYRHILEDIRFKRTAFKYFKFSIWKMIRHHKNTTSVQIIRYKITLTKKLMKK